MADSVVARKHHGALAVSRGRFPEKPVEAPSVAVPESIIPSADASGPKPVGVSFQMLVNVTRSVCLRVSGAVAPSAPALKPISPDVTVSNR